MILTFFGAKKEAKKHPPPPSRPLYWAGVISSGQKPPSIKVLVWLAKPVPCGRAMSFYRLAQEKKNRVFLASIKIKS
jgi:hypothetical protein